MILLVSCFVTNKSGNGGLWDSIGVSQDRGNLRRDNKVDILKYTLSSLVNAFPWSKVIIKTELDDAYSSPEEKSKLKEYVYDIFKNHNLIFSDKRNLHQSDWIESYDLIKDDDYVFCYCTHDHVMTDHSSTYLEEIIKSAQNTYPDENVIIALSHWSEFVRNLQYKGPGTSYNTHNNVVPHEKNLGYKLEDKYGSFLRPPGDSIHIISTKLYKNLFLTGKWDDYYNLYAPNTFKTGKIELPRIDGVGIIDIGIIRNYLMKVPMPLSRWIVPYRELCRHFDGYFYHGITNNQAPSLEIPAGFFDNNIKIRYGYSDRKEGWVNINPDIDNYYAYDKNGADYKITLEELPLFWKDKISEIDVNPNLDRERIIQYRLKTVLEMIYTSENHNPFIEKNLENKILQEYMKLFPEYQIV